MCRCPFLSLGYHHPTGLHLWPHFISFNIGNVKLSWSMRWTQRTQTKILINPVLWQEHGTLLHWWEMNGMSDLQMVSVSSEPSGQSGSPSQSQASGTQVFRSRQWNSPMSHKMASKMAWGKEWGKKEGEMQHEVMTGKQVAHMISRMYIWTWAQMLLMELVTDKSQLPAVWVILKVTPPPPKDRMSFMPYCKHFWGYNLIHLGSVRI